VRRITRNCERHRIVLLLTCMGCLVAACGGAGSEAIGVDVAFDSGLPRAARDQAMRVEVYLLESCDAVSTGDRPNDAIASTHTLRDGGNGPLIGKFDPGQYGLYALAQDATCAVVAAGCSAITIEGGAQDPMSVTLGASPGVGCAADEQCVIEIGECLGPDAGAFDCSVEPDQTPCSTDGANGVCREAECCTGCWDGKKCRSGTESKRCGVGGEQCYVCE